MKYICLLFSVYVIYLEWMNCKRLGCITAMFLASAYNFVFLHLWICADYFKGYSEIYDDRVVWSIFFNDIVWVAFLQFRKPFVRKCSVNNKNLLTPGEKKSAYLLFLVSVAVSAYYLSHVGISLLSADVDYVRHVAKKGSGYYNIFVTRGLTLAVAILFVGQMSGRINGSFGWILILITCIIQLATGFRAYAANTLMILALIYVSIGGQVKISNVVSVAILGFSTFVLVTAYKNNMSLFSDYFFDDVWKQIDHRIISDLPRVLQRIVGLVDYYGTMKGKTFFMDLYSALPGPGYSFGDQLFLWLMPSNAVAGIAPLTPSNIGEGYANLGYVGVIIETLVTLKLIVFIDQLENKNALIIALKAILSIMAAEIIAVGFGAVVVSRFLPLSVFVTIYILALAYYGRYDKNR